jgi:hypothetical protein
MLTPEGETLLAFSDVPFDAERGEVVLACQLHYRGIGPNEIVVKMTAVEPTGSRLLGEYRLNHSFTDV